MNARHTRLRSLMNENVCDAVLISEASNIAYLTGYQGFSDVEREAFLFVTEKNAFLVTDSRYNTATEKIKGVQTIVRSKDKSLSDIIDKICEKEALQVLGFEANNVTVSEYVHLKKTKRKWKAIDLRNLRNVKSEDEIDEIRTATSLSHQALKKIIPIFSTTITEIELVQKLELEMKLLGVNPSFPTIVAFGENAAIPHHVSGNTPLKTDDLILVDFGDIHNGYCSDTTRTFFKGAVPEKWKAIYKIVEESQQLAVDFIHRQLQRNKKIKASEVDMAAREYIVKKGYPTIPHALGHGIGLHVHESPTLSPHSKDILTDGMVFSIEPGIYLPGEMGVRIEDLFTIKGNELLNLS